jgi:hypothetical protein
MTSQNPPTDLNLTRQIINQVLVDEYLRGRYAWPSRVLQRLAEMGITHLPSNNHRITRAYLGNLRILLQKGTQEASFPSIFRGLPGSRYHKDLMYERFWALVDYKLGDKLRSYIGLPANQLESIDKRVGGFLIACEQDPGVCSWMDGYLEKFLRHRRKSLIGLYNIDILQFLETENSTFNIVDLDLMECLTDIPRIQRIGQAIARRAESVCAVNVTSCIGRRITYQDYENLVPSELKKAFRHGGIKVVEHYRFRYRDRVIPMACEHFLLTK